MKINFPTILQESTYITMEENSPHITQFWLEIWPILLLDQTTLP